MSIGVRMKEKETSAEQIIAKLREVEALLGQGSTVDEASRKPGITEQITSSLRKNFTFSKILIE